MRLSLSIQSDILKAKAGSILNTFKIHSRRDVLFFEDILAQYIHECEQAGFEKEMMHIGKKWCALETELIPGYMRAIAPEFIINQSIKHVWGNIGLADDFNVVRAGNLYTVKTKNEFITRVIGENNFMCGLFAGAAAGFHKADVICCEHLQTKEYSCYTLQFLKTHFTLASKTKESYNKLNDVPTTEGVSLKKAITSGFFKLGAGNRITFRGKTMLCLENSGFHIMGSSGIMLDRLSEITASFFDSLVAKEVDASNKIVLLKTILQSCGWGKVTVALEGKEISFSIDHPPFGLQAEEDNWLFLAYFILGYLHSIRKNIVLKESELQGKRLLLKYTGL